MVSRPCVKLTMWFKSGHFVSKVLVRKDISLILSKIMEGYVLLMMLTHVTILGFDAFATIVNFVNNN
jgi:hypothetical protein